MSRPYTLKRRAEQQADTRRRIVEAAVDLHGSVGPALTTLTMIAERAGVQRHTLYAHFPDDRSLFLACSAMSMERDPLPDAEAWQAIAAPAERLEAGLTALYGWYARNEALTACVLRDAEYHPLTREIAELRIAPVFDKYRQILGAGLAEPQGALLRLALSFFTWRTVARDGGLTAAAAARALARATLCAG